MIITLEQQPRGETLSPPAPPRRTQRLVVLAALAALALVLAIIGLLLATQHTAHATSKPDSGTSSTRTPDGSGYASAGVVPGGTCTTPGVVARHGTQQYRCWQKPGEVCPHWHWVYRPDVPKSTRTAWPAAPCTACSPTATPPMTPPATTPPVATSSPTPTPAGVPRPVDTTPPAAVDVPVATQPPTTTGTLPVTGAPAGVTALVGLLLALAGVGLRFRPRRC